MPNTFAYVMFYCWPLVVLVFFRKMPLPAALAWSIVAGYLLLPDRVAIDWPMVPTISKYSMPGMVAAVMCLVVAGTQNVPMRRDSVAIPENGDTSRQTGRRPVRSTKLEGPKFVAQPPAIRGGLILRILLALLLISPVLTVMENPEPVVAGPLFIPGIRIYDALSIIGGLFIALLPFLLAKRFLATEETHLTLLKVLCLAALGYSILALYEIRMSPQLNLKIYGFFPHSFLQHMRGDGFRPLVFLPHGLWLGIFQAMGVLAAAVLWRHSKSTRGSYGMWRAATWYLLGVMFLSKNFGALSIAVILLFCILLLSIRGQMIVAGCIAVIILFYPVLRSSNVIPTERVVVAAGFFSAERAGSLQTRLGHEDSLLAKAQQKPLAGWGTWGRNRIYHERTGADLSLTDGMWVIVIGTYGWLGYIAQFGLLTLPLVLLLRQRRNLTLATSGLALVHSANLLDMIPNATLTPVSWLIGGALMGCYATIRTRDQQATGAQGRLERREGLTGNRAVAAPLNRPSRAQRI